MNSGSNWPQNQNSFGMNSGSNWPQNQNSFGMNSGSNWPQQNNPNSFGQSSGSFGQSSNNLNSDFASNQPIPPYRRPYNSGSSLQAAMTLVVTTILAAIMAI